MFGIGGSYEESSSQDSVWDVQEFFLQQLYTAALGQMNQQRGEIGGAARGLSERLMGGAMPSFEMFGDMAAGRTTGQQALQGMLGQNPWLQSEIDALGSDISTQLNRDILPELRSGGIAAGSPGGSRAGIAEGMAVQGAQDAFSEGSSALRFQDLGRRQRAANQLISSQAMGGQGAMAAAPQLYNLGMSPYSSAWLPLTMMGGILGRPTVLGESDSWGISGEASAGA